jgi:imidazole glycerol phosphate synthase glutamine amidotransferase subunit
MITLVLMGEAGLSTLEGAIQRLGFQCVRAEDPDQAPPAGPLILSGSGPFDQAAAALRDSGWWSLLPQFVADGRPLLGLNLGMHLLAEGSEESPRGSGLGLLPGLARRLGPGVKIPHTGWCRVARNREHPCMPDPRGGWLHFAHCHALEPGSETVASALHGRAFSVLEVRGRVLGMQARPEKSGPLGLVLLEKMLLWMGEKPQPAPAAELCN